MFAPRGVNTRRIPGIQGGQSENRCQGRQQEVEIKLHNLTYNWVKKYDRLIILYFMGNNWSGEPETAKGNVGYETKMD